MVRGADLWCQLGKTDFTTSGTERMLVETGKGFFI